MAFQQPTRQAVARPIRDNHDDHDSPEHSIFAGPQPTTEESQTWVLFSPTADTETTTGGSSVLSSLPDSQPTPGRSRLSDLGSLTRSNYASNYASSYAQSSVAAPRPAPLHLSLLSSSLSNTNGDALTAERTQGNDAEEDAELDSLDSHLADFRGAPSSALALPSTTQPQSQAPTPLHMTTTATTVNLPTHDGLGSFRLGNTIGMGASAVQEHLYAFEQFNPRRVVKRRRESLDLAAQIELDQDLVDELERTRRIEEWRWDHSRVLLEEIQKQTRRRRGSELSARRSRPGVETTTEAAGEPLSGEANGDWHDQEEDERLLGKRKLDGDEDGSGENEGVWSRITRKFMHEVMGIDDRILSIIFGESMAQTEEDQQHNGEEIDEVDLSSTPKASDSIRAAAAAVDSSVDDKIDQYAQQDESPPWQLRMIERIAKELGIFVHQHMSTHPGAFSTFVRVQQMPLPYAGLPVIPEALTPPDREIAIPIRSDSGKARSRNRSGTADDLMAATTTATGSMGPHFKPTIYQAKPMDIPGQASGDNKTGLTMGSAASATSSSATAGPTAFTQDEWEQDLDITLVFRYLRSRFMSDKTPTPSHIHHHVSHHRRGSSSSSISMQDAAAKAARVRQHHPLVGRNAARQAGDRRAVPAYRNMNIAGTATPASPILNVTVRHPHGTASCASQSTRRSARRSSVSSRHSSRHYWDIGGSIGTGSVIASAGPMGSWGDA